MAQALPRHSRRRFLSLAAGAAASGAVVATRGAVAAYPAPAASLLSLPPRAVVTREGVLGALPQLDQLVQETMTKTAVPGIAVTVVYNDEVVYLKGFGVRDTANPATVDADTVFQLASVSKPIGATAIAGIVGDGKVSWDDPLAKYLPEFKMDVPWISQNVTIRDMFSHRSGLPDHAGDLLEDIGYDRATTLSRLRYFATGDNFRTHYAYTNFGLTAGGVAAAKAAGQTWEEMIDRRLFQPLGMTRSSPRSADFFANGNRAAGHVRVDGKWVAKYRRDPDTESPAGGVSSSVRDLARWMRLLLAGGKMDGTQIIAADALAEMYRPQMVKDSPKDPSKDFAGFYGLGWNVSYDRQGNVHLGHSGAFALGAGTMVALRPALNLGIVVLTNAAPMGAAETIGATFTDIVEYGAPQRDYAAFFPAVFAAATQSPYGTAVDYTKPPAQLIPPQPPATYTGAYTNDLYGPIAVVMDGGNLVLQTGPNKTPFPLKHFSGNTYVFQPAGENAYGLSAVTFTMATEEKATSVTIDYFNVLGYGTFFRVAGS